MFLVKTALLSSFAFYVLAYCFFPASSFHQFLSTMFGFAQIYAFPLVIGAGFSLLSGLLALWSHFKGQKENRFFLIVTFTLSILLCLFGADWQTEIAKGESTTAKIVEWNAADTLTTQEVTQIFKTFDADIAVFPELEGYFKGDDSHQRLTDVFDQSGLSLDDYAVFISPRSYEDIAPVTVLIKKSFGTYQAIDESPQVYFGLLHLQSQQAHLPDIIALHTAPPLPGLMRFWKNDLDTITKEVLSQFPSAIVLGDFNATMRHGALSSIDTHVDALNALPLLERGTWPSQAHPFFQSSIDHILFPKENTSVQNITIDRFEHSDHRAIFAEIAFSDR